MGFHYRDSLSAIPNNKNPRSYSVVDPALFIIPNTALWLFSSNPKHSINTVFVERVFWAKFLLLTKLTLPNKLTYIADGLQFSTAACSWVVQFNTNNMLSDTRVHVVTSLPLDDYTLISSTTLFRSSIWLERELSDFTNIHFTGLLDTRRLLLDYFEEKQVCQSHVFNDKNFNNNLYDVSLSY